MVKEIKVIYKINDEGKEIVIPIHKKTIPFLISNLCLIKEQLIGSLRLVDGSNRFKLSLDHKLKGASILETSNKSSQLIFSIDSFEYAYHFILDLYKQGYGNVSHIHVDFYDNVECISVIFLIEDDQMVQWNDEILS